MNRQKASPSTPASSCLVLLLLAVFLMPGFTSILEFDQETRDGTTQQQFEWKGPSVTNDSGLSLNEDGPDNTENISQSMGTGSDDIGYDDNVSGTLNFLQDKEVDEGRWIGDGAETGGAYTTHRKIAYEAVKYIMEDGNEKGEFKLDDIITIPIPGSGWRPPTPSSGYGPTDGSYNGLPEFDDGLPRMPGEDRTSEYSSSEHVCYGDNNHLSQCFYRYDVEPYLKDPDGNIVTDEDGNEVLDDKIQVYAHWLLEAYSSYPDILDEGLLERRAGHGVMPALLPLYESIAGYQAIMEQLGQELPAEASSLQRLSAPGNAQYYVELSLKEFGKMYPDLGLAYYYLGLASHFVQDAGTIMHVGFTLEQALEISQVKSTLKERNLDGIAIHDNFEMAVNGPKGESTPIAGTTPLIDQISSAKGARTILGPVTADDASGVRLAVQALSLMVAGMILPCGCGSIIDLVLLPTINIPNGHRHCIAVHMMLLIELLEGMPAIMDRIDDANNGVTGFINSIVDAIVGYTPEEVQGIVNSLETGFQVLNTAVFDLIDEVDLSFLDPLMKLSIENIWNYIITPMTVRDLELTTSTLIGVYNKVLQNAVAIDIKLVEETKSIALNPGGSINKKVIVTNQNENDLNFILELDPRIDTMGWEYAVTPSSDQEGEYYLESGESITLNLEMTPDITENEIDYGINTFELKVISDGRKDVTEFDVKVKRPNLIASEVRFNKVPKAGEEITIFGTVSNGGGITGMSEVELKFQEARTGLQVGETISYLPQEPGERTTFKVQWVPPSPLGIAEIQFVVDDGQVQEESNEYDNLATQTVGWGQEVPMDRAMSEGAQFLVDDSGIIHVVTAEYSQNGIGQGDLLYYSFDKHGQVLVDGQRVITEGQKDATVPKIAIDSNGEMVIFWADESFTQGERTFPYYMTKIPTSGEGGSFTPVKLLTDVGGPDTASVALDSADNIYLTYWKDNKIHFNSFSTQGISQAERTLATTFEKEEADALPFIHISEFDDLMVMYPDLSDMGERVVTLERLYLTGNSETEWELQREDHDVIGSYPLDLVMDELDGLHVLWYASKAGGIKELLYTPISSTDELIDPSLIEVGYYERFRARMVIDSNEILTIGWLNDHANSKSEMTSVKYTQIETSPTVSNSWKGQFRHYGVVNTNLEDLFLHIDGNDQLYLGWTNTVQASAINRNWVQGAFRSTVPYPDLRVLSEDIQLDFNEQEEGITISASITSEFYESITTDYSIYSVMESRTLDTGMVNLGPYGTTTLETQGNYIEGNTYLVSLNEQRLILEPDLSNNQASRTVSFDSYMSANGGMHGGSTSLAPGPSSPVYKTWEKEISDEALSMPVGLDDKVVVSSADGWVCALATHDGEQLWAVDLESDIAAAPTLIRKGLIDATGNPSHLVIIPTLEGEVFLLQMADGNQIWQTTIPQAEPIFAPVMVAGEMALVVSENGKVYSFDLTSGKLLWSFHADGKIQGTPFYHNSALGFGTDAGIFYLLESTTGKLIWERFLGEEKAIAGSPSYSDGLILVQTKGNGDSLYALDFRDGSSRWQTSGPKDGTTGIAIAYGKAFVTSNSIKVYAFDLMDGELVWSFITGQFGTSPPVIANDKVLFGSNNGQIYALDQGSGEVAWTVSAQEAGYSGIIPLGHEAYATSNDGNIIKLAQNLAPKANFSAHLNGRWLNDPLTVHWREIVTFKATGSGDPNDDELTFTWDFNHRNGKEVNADGYEVTHSFNNIQRYRVTLTVSDGLLESEAERWIQITNSKPLAIISSFTELVEGSSNTIQVHWNSPTTFTASESYDLDGDPLTFFWDFDIRDGIQVDSSEMEVVHTFASSGIHKVTLTVSDGQASHSSFFIVNATNHQPKAFVSSSSGETSGILGEDILFSSTGSFDPNGDELFYFWDFGDGFASNDANPSHDFAQFPQGTAIVTFFVSDGDMRSSSVQIPVLINAHHDVELTTLDDSKQVTPGKSTVFKVWIENRGNVLESEITITRVEDDIHYWMVDGLNSIELIQPFSSRFLDVTVQVPANVSEFRTYELELEASLLGGADSSRLSIFCDVTESVPVALDLMVEGSNQEQTFVDPATGDHLAVFTLFLENQGDTVETFHVGLSEFSDTGDGWLVYLCHNEVAGQICSVEVANGQGIQILVLVLWENADDSVRFHVDAWLPEDPDTFDFERLTVIHE